MRQYKQKRAGLFDSIERQARKDFTKDVQRMLAEEQLTDMHSAITLCDISPYSTLPILVLAQSHKKRY